MGARPRKTPLIHAVVACVAAAYAHTSRKQIGVRISARTRRYALSNRPERRFLAGAASPANRARRESGFTMQSRRLTCSLTFLDVYREFNWAEEEV